MIFKGFPPHGSPYQVCGVCVTTMNRMFLLPHLLYRWSGLSIILLLIHSPLVIVLNGPSSDQSSMIRFLSRTYLPNRLITILYILPPSSPENGQFPVNKLRNLGIRNIVGTHFQILDMDLWPTMNLYETMMSLPRSITENDNAAVILPVFFFDRKQMLHRCDSIRSCVQLYSISKLFHI